MGEGSLEILVDLDLTARIRGDAKLVEPERLDIAAAARRDKDDVNLETRIGLKLDFKKVVWLDRPFGIVEKDLDSARLHLLCERVDDLRVERRNQPIALFDQRHLDSQSGKHAGVFAADHAAAHDQHGRRHFMQVDDGVRIVDA